MTFISVDAELSDFPDREIVDYVAKNDHLFQAILTKREELARSIPATEKQIVERDFRTWLDLHGVQR